VTPDALRKIVERRNVWPMQAQKDIATLLDALVEESAYRVEADFLGLTFHPPGHEVRWSWKPSDWKKQAIAELGLDGVWQVK